MPTEGRITPLPTDHPSVIDAVREMRRAQAWVLVAVDREITVGIAAPQINFAGQLPKVSLLAETAPNDINYTIALFECAHSVIGNYLETLKQHRDNGGDQPLPGEQRE